MRHRISSCCRTLCAQTNEYSQNFGRYSRRIAANRTPCRCYQRARLQRHSHSLLLHKKSAHRRPDGSVGMALVLPALTDCRWWFESLLVHSGVSSATRRKATGADHKKKCIRSLRIRVEARANVTEREVISRQLQLMHAGVQHYRTEDLNTADTSCLSRTSFEHFDDRPGPWAEKNARIPTPMELSQLP